MSADQDTASVPGIMRAWATSAAAGELMLGAREVPVPDESEVLVRVEACGVCRTDLHVIDQDLPVHRPRVVPGHQIVGIVVASGDDVRTIRVGDRVGVAWLRHTCGTCPWCRRGQENLCPSAEFTGWDADGGFAEYTVAPAAYVYPLPSTATAAVLAPLLCAGIIGYRSLARASLPPGGTLGIYGFGSSAHLTAQIAAAQGARIAVMTRGEGNRELAKKLRAAFIGDATARPPFPLDAAIVFAPAGELVPVALQATRAGGTVVLAGIHMSNIPAMEYGPNLFRERDLRTVTANTRTDGETFLRLASALEVRADITRYPFSAVDVALGDLRSGRASGSLVITM